MPPELDTELQETMENGAPLGAALAEFAKVHSPDNADTLLSDAPKNNRPGSTDAPPADDDPPAGDPPEDGKPAPGSAPTEDDAAKLAEQAKADAEKAETEAKAAAEALKTEHADLEKIAAQNDPGMRPKTRKQFEAIKAEAIKARVEAKKAAADFAAAQTALKELEAKSKDTAIPENVTKELTSLREKVRELDISQDPEIKTKYDGKISSNQDAIVATLKNFGFAKIKDGDKTIDAPDASRQIEDLKRNGLTFKNLQPMIENLRKAGEHDAAETISDAIRENQRLARDKDTEISSWKQNYETRTAERSQQTKAQQDAHNKAIQQASGATLAESLGELSKKFPWFNKPEGPKAGDPPAIAKAKTQAVAEHEAAEKAVAEMIKGYDATGLNGEALAKTQGKTAAAIVEAINVKAHILPRVEKEMTALKARNAELEAELGKFKKGGAMSRAHAAAITSPHDGPQVDPKASLSDALAQMAKASGIKI